MTTDKILRNMVYGTNYNIRASSEKKNDIKRKIYLTAPPSTVQSFYVGRFVDVTIFLGLIASLSYGVPRGEIYLSL